MDLHRCTKQPPRTEAFGLLKMNSVLLFLQIKKRFTPKKKVYDRKECPISTKRNSRGHVFHVLKICGRHGTG